MNTFQAATAVCVLAGLLSSCGTTTNIANLTKAGGGKVFAVTADKTSFYRYGPQQGNGADEELPRNTLVTLIRPSFGYCKVQLMSGAQEGYVASEDIKPAPPTMLAALTAPAVRESATSSSDVEHFDVRSTDPNFVPPPEALPDPDLPPTATEPLPTP